MNQTPRNILVVRTDRLGDVILTLPVCSTLHTAFPGVRVSMLVRTYVRPIIAGNPFVEDAVWVDDEGGVPKDFFSLRKELDEKNFDAAVIVRPTFRISLLVFTARISRRVGTGYRWYSWLFTDRLYEHRKTAERHELEYNLRLLRPLGIEVSSSVAPDFGIRVPSDVRQEITAILRSFGIEDDEKVVVLHPASGGSAREWPPDRFRELGLRLAEIENVKVVVTGMPSEERTLRRVLESSCPPFVSLVGRLTLPILTGLLERASLFIANSTGPLHLAGALGTPVIGLYPPVRPMSAARWGPYGENGVALSGDGPGDCQRCAKGGRCACMLSIQINQVLDAAVALLKSSSMPKGRGAA